MSDRPTSVVTDPRWGLCALCTHARLIESDRGSAFAQCGLATTDPRYRKYPYVPVGKCDGYLARQSAAFPPDFLK